MTLFLSRLRLDPRNHTAASNLNRPYELHRTLLRAFPSMDNGGPGRVLFRSEPIQRTEKADVTVLVQSDSEPDWDRACREYPSDLLSAPPDCRTVPTNFKLGTVLRFRLRANPTVRRVRLPDGARDERKNRPRHALYREDEQLSWLERQGKCHGFDLVESGDFEWLDMEAFCARHDVVVSDEGMIRTGKKTQNGHSRHYSVLFDGRLIVKEPADFSKALHNGVGPAKAFGFGLLSVAPG